MQNFDVIICGAGPAGTTCALALFDAGLNVVLLDKESFPREKVCGDAYGGYAYKILNTISPVFGEKLQLINQGVNAKQAKFFSPGGFAYTLKLNGFFSNLPRIVFDDFLLNMVKVETNTVILENTIAKKVEVHEDYVSITTQMGEELRAKVVVGCDGAHSIVQSTITKTRKSKTDSFPSLRGYFKNVKDVDDDCIELHFLKQVPHGYFWIFPSTNGMANVGVGTNQKKGSENNINIKKVFFDLIKEAPQFKERFANAELVGDVKGWTIPTGYFNSSLSISDKRVLLCGDAAALVNPLTKEGIAPAMSSGRYAGKHIKDCFANNDFSAAFMKKYDKVIHKKYAKEYFKNQVAANFFYKTPFIADCCFCFFNGLKKLKITR